MSTRQNPTVHQVTHIRTEVWQAVEAMQSALEPFSEEIRELALKQIEIENDVRVVARRRLEGPQLSETPPSTQKAPTEFMTIDMVADRCQVSKAAVAKWLGSGELRKNKAGRRVLISEVDFQAFLGLSAKGV